VIDEGGGAWHAHRGAVRYLARYQCVLPEVARQETIYPSARSTSWTSASSRPSTSPGWRGQSGPPARSSSRTSSSASPNYLWDEWFTINRVYDREFQFKGYYCDVITPIQKSCTKLAVTDLFLDVFVFPTELVGRGRGRVRGRGLAWAYGREHPEARAEAVTSSWAWSSQGISAPMREAVPQGPAAHAARAARPFPMIARARAT